MQASWQDMPGPRRQFKTTRSNLFSTTGHQGISDVLTRAGVLQSGPGAHADDVRDDDEDADMDMYAEADAEEEEGWLVAADDRVCTAAAASQALESSFSSCLHP